MNDQQEMLRQARKDLTHCEETIARVKASQMERWRVMAGDALLSMLQSRQQAESYLHHDDPHVRCVAISVLSHVWKPDVQLTKECERLYSNDPDNDVREVALTVLGHCYRGTNDREFGKKMAGIVSNASQPISLRQLAYINLFDVRGLSPEHWPLDDDFTESKIDKRFVESFL